MKDHDSLKSQSITLRVTANDVFWSLRTGQENPALLALQRATRMPWHIEGTQAREGVAPFRACHLPQVELGDEPWQRAEELTRREWCVELRSTSPKG